MLRPSLPQSWLAKIGEVGYGASWARWALCVLVIISETQIPTEMDWLQQILFRIWVVRLMYKEATEATWKAWIWIHCWNPCFSFWIQMHLRGQCPSFPGDALGCWHLSGWNLHRRRQNELIIWGCLRDSAPKTSTRNWHRWINSSGLLLVHLPACYSSILAVSWMVCFSF